MAKLRKAETGYYRSFSIKYSAEWLFIGITMVIAFPEILENGK